MVKSCSSSIYIAIHSCFENKFSKHCSCQVSIWTQLFVFTWQILQRFICMKASHTVIFNGMSYFYDIKAACLESWSCWVVVEQNFWGKKYQLIAFVHNERGSNVFLWMLYDFLDMNVCGMFIKEGDEINWDKYERNKKRSHQALQSF